MAFKVGDKVTHRSWGEGEIAFGPFQRDGMMTHYLMKQTRDGEHRLADEEAMKPADKFKIGDKVKSRFGTIYTVEAGPFFAPGEWYALKNDGTGNVVHSHADAVSLVEPANNTYTHDGVTYDITAKYRDRDGDVWYFARFGDKVVGLIGSRPKNADDGDPFSTAAQYGPLTKI